MGNLLNWLFPWRKEPWETVCGRLEVLEREFSRLARENDHLADRLRAELKRADYVHAAIDSRLKNLDMRIDCLKSAQIPVNWGGNRFEAPDGGGEAAAVAFAEAWYDENSSKIDSSRAMLKRSADPDPAPEKSIREADTDVLRQTLRYIQSDGESPLAQVYSETSIRMELSRRGERV